MHWQQYFVFHIKIKKKRKHSYLIGNFPNQENCPLGTCECLKSISLYVLSKTHIFFHCLYLNKVSRSPRFAFLYIFFFNKSEPTKYSRSSSSRTLKQLIGYKKVCLKFHKYCTLTMRVLIRNFVKPTKYFAWTHHIRFSTLSLTLFFCLCSWFFFVRAHFLRRSQGNISLINCSSHTTKRWFSFITVIYIYNCKIVHFVKCHIKRTKKLQIHLLKILAEIFLFVCLSFWCTSIKNIVPTFQKEEQMEVTWICIISE